MRSLVRVVAGVLTAAAVLGAAACNHVVSRYERAFSDTRDGEMINDVLARFGEPTLRETPAKPFNVYADEGCNAPCTTRLWWEHPLLRGIEAWSVAVNAGNQVIGKTHWVSP